MKNVNDIVNIAKNSEDNALAQLTTDTSIDISLPTSFATSKDTESNKSNQTNQYPRVHNKSGETSSKRQKTECSLTPENKNINSATLNNDASCSYTISTSILTKYLKKMLIEIGVQTLQINLSQTRGFHVQLKTYAQSVYI